MAGAGNDLGLQVLESRSLLQETEDMRPIDIAVPRAAVLVPLAVVVMEMAVHDMREHLFKGMVLPGDIVKSRCLPAFAGRAFVVVASLVHQIGVSCIVGEAQRPSWEKLLDLQ